MKEVSSLFAPFAYSRAIDPLKHRGRYVGYYSNLLVSLARRVTHRS